MGIYVCFHRLSREKFVELENNFDRAAVYFRLIDSTSGNSVWSETFDEKCAKLSLEKEWGALNYLLNGRLSPLEQLALRQQNKGNNILDT